MFGKKYQRDKRKKLLYEILKFGGAITIVFLAPGAAPFILKPFMEKNNISNSELNRSLKAMNDDGLISIRELKDGSVVVRLKKEGKIKALRYQVEELEIKRPKKWDKRWRIVIFDIPEKHKVARNVLKSKLDELGFKLIQKSIYLYPFPCENEVDFIASVYGINNYIQIIRADKIQNEDKLMELFNI